MEASLVTAGMCVVAYAARCLMVWVRTRRDADAAVSQHRAGAHMVQALPTGSRVRMRSAAGDEVVIEVGKRITRRVQGPHGG
ncbi:hypothetical protein [Streptomyces sp. NBC_00140]|uniref:hypothetical protein n=1 Tax=Streptomyces sp. NBC_00140 TaxID=2975664 RepID=UPI002257C813|nr:hypothetical protein [Streptomyces sp. NBC_00140]MCX5328545.1 hypothetical protein [Streptomyces sp. NBC_00140]